MEDHPTHFEMVKLEKEIGASLPSSYLTRTLKKVKDLYNNAKVFEAGYL